MHVDAASRLDPAHARAEAKAAKNALSLATLAHLAALRDGDHQAAAAALERFHQAERKLISATSEIVR